MKKVNHIAILVDASGSTQSIAGKLLEQVNKQLVVARDRGIAEDQENRISIYTFAEQAARPLFFDVPLTSCTINPLTRAAYDVGGGTAMLDSIGMAIGDLDQHNKDLSGADHSFMLMCITDGEENVSRKFTKTVINDLMRTKQRTDIWSFTFQVPDRFSKDKLMRDFSIPEGNISVWDTTTDRGVEKMGNVTSSALSGFMAGRSVGVRSTKQFYKVDLSAVSTKAAQDKLVEVTKNFNLLTIEKKDVPVKDPRIEIRDFCEKRLGSFQQGDAFYELTKPEDVQAHKDVVVENIYSGKRYGGAEARTLIGLPSSASGIEVRLKPGDHGSFKIYIQSTSWNRKLPVGTTLLYRKSAVATA